MTTSATLPPTTARGWPATARLAAGGLAGFAQASVAAGLADPGYDPVREGISALAATNSPSAYVMIAGFLMLAGGTIAAGVGIWSRLRVGIAGRVGAALVVLAGVGMVVAAFARQDCSDFIGACAAAEQAGTLSDHHVLHQLVSLLVFTLLAVAAFVLARGLRRSGAWAHLAMPSTLVGVAGIVFTAVLVAVGFGEAAGLVQRLWVLVVFGWPAVLAAAARRAS
jgi:hypothetical membrane protein